jgi:hypothetical protein
VTSTSRRTRTRNLARPYRAESRWMVLRRMPNYNSRCGLKLGVKTAQDVNLSNFGTYTLQASVPVLPPTPCALPTSITFTPLSDSHRVKSGTWMILSVTSAILASSTRRVYALGSSLFVSRPRSRGRALYEGPAVNTLRKVKSVKGTVSNTCFVQILNPIKTLCS